MKDRIILLIKALNYTAAQFAEEIGVQKSGISHIISGRNNPSLDFINKILLRFPQVNMEWLMMGKGAMIKSDQVLQPPRETTLFAYTESDQSTPDLFTAEIFNSGEVKEQEKQSPQHEQSLTNDHINPVPVAKEVVIEKQTEIRTAGRREFSPNLEKSTFTSGDKRIERILFFYSDNTFKEYRPEN
jgi:transcriptional regulator with XRE-family HTH domain